METRIYVLRHAHPQVGEVPNRDRPLSEQGLLAAFALVPYLRGLGCAAVYSSPFARAVGTVLPYCTAEAVPMYMLESLAESKADETLVQVRDRMVRVVSVIADSHPGKAVLVCTHGGNMWGLLTASDASFSYEQYRELGTPDMRLLRWSGVTGILDSGFRFDAQLGDVAATNAP